MNRERLLDEVRLILAKTGFYLSDKANTRGLAFDVVARRDEVLLLVKVLLNVDAFSKQGAEELRMIATTLKGAPLLVGERSSAGPLEDGVIYARSGVPILSGQTFKDFFEEGVPPFIFSAPGGLYVKLDGEALRRAREEKQVSLGALAEVAGVSRRAIQMYLDGMSATIDIALRLEEYLGEPLVVPMDPFLYTSRVADLLTGFEEFERFERDVFRRLSRLGYDVLPTVKCPFEAFTKDREVVLLTGVTSAGERAHEKASIVSNLARVIERDSVLFVERRVSRTTLEGTAVIGKDELKKIKDRAKILELIEERKS
ncbi:MAG: transcriptional regulator [Methanobacteriota archaeon]|nr:MAG: transcriptional regulator [Euryarchaeota archaeon]